MEKAAFHIVLYQPKIPQNTGSIARLAACTGAALHLIHPLGFRTDAPSVKRAGLDYWAHVEIYEHANWQTFLNQEQPKHLFFFSKRASQAHWDAHFSCPVYLVFGSETDGLPEDIHARHKQQLFKVPMRTHLVRSLNLAQCAAIVLYEAIRASDMKPCTS